MEYGKIIAVTGIPGLYELLSSKNDGAIVRSLEDKSTKFLSSRIHNFSHLESIEVFTVRDNVNLSEIFHAMEQSGEKIPDAKDGAALKKYFEKIYPELDFERVYSSDLKKMVKWFSVLKDNQIEIKLTPVEEESPAEEIQEPAAQPAEKTAAPQKAPAKKKAEKGKEDKSDTVDATAKAPVKKKAEKETKAKAAKPKETETKAPAKKAAPKKKTKE
ncbi:MAG: DUF5606 domain-containing protein [Chitinophagaceae bacterium]|nr:DUF5606 domain-containing protein [Chitinophagaceae bacterium]